MDFETKYPKELRPHGFEPPHLEIEFEPRIFWTGRVFCCQVCSGPTGFHLNRLDTLPSSPCCSDDCKLVAIEYEASEDPNFIFPSPDSSAEERSPDVAEVVGSIPTPGTTFWEQVLLHMLEAANEIS